MLGDFFVCLFSSELFEYIAPAEKEGKVTLETYQKKRKDKEN